MFALYSNPQNPEMQPGELLLLQLVKGEARRARKLDRRIEYALVFDHLEKDTTGALSRQHWPRAGREWPWIVYGSTTVATIPFSLEDLGLSNSYEGQTNPRRIAPADEPIVRPYIPWAPDAGNGRGSAPFAGLPSGAGRKGLLSAIYNFDRIAAARGAGRRRVARSRQEFVRNQALAESLKIYYGYRCQICKQSFTSVYGVQLAEAHHIQYLRNGGPDVSQNLIVICPNHHGVIHATDAEFDRAALAYRYPNGLVEKVKLRDHFESAPAASLSLFPPDPAT